MLLHVQNYKGGGFSLISKRGALFDVVKFLLGAINDNEIVDDDVVLRGNAHSSF